MSTRSIRIRFSADESKPTTFHYKPLQDEDPPLPLPIDPDQCILQASTPILRSQTSQFTYCWGKTEFFDKSFPIFICASSSAPSAPILVLKTALHINDGKPKYIKDRIDDLEYETTVYQKQLRGLQGVWVPEHYGIWESEETSWAGVIQCWILRGY